MRRFVPAPLLSVALFVLWFLLGAAPSLAQVVLATVVALVVPVIVAPLRPGRVRIRRPALVLWLVAVVLRDSLGSNLHVARALLRRRDRLPTGAFVRVPLALTDPGGLAVLAIITTIIPGTLWCELAHDRSTVLLHVLDPGDEAAFVAHYKDTYERPLREIFA
ncbi:MAG: Na+/H+ antiporter subunit E [Betaproteobacteria bacterium]